MSQRLFIVYLTTNNFNNEYYIGYHGTDDINDGYLGSGLKLLRSVKKYGRENFIREVLFVYENSAEAFTKESEIVNIITLQDPCCLNLVGGGRGSGEHSLYSREKMSEAAKNRSPETRKKMSEAAKNRSPETRKKMSEWERTPEYRKKMSKSKKNMSPETREKISESWKNRSPATQETRAKMSIAQKNRAPATPETRKKISKAQRKITDDQIKEIIKLSETGMTQTAIAKIFGVSKSTIHRYLKKYKGVSNCWYSEMI